MKRSRPFLERPPCLLGSRGELVEGLVLPIYVPVSLRRERPGHKGWNLISQMVVPLPVGAADPGRRLRQIAAETARRKGAGPSVPGPCSAAGSPPRAMLKFIPLALLAVKETPRQLA